MADILVVDDSKFMRKILTDILVAKGHRIVGEAENAEEAISSCQKLKPDLVTLDIIMPGVKEGNAVSVLKEIVKQHPHTSVIMVSALGQEQVVKECIQAGARDFITKPFEPDQIAQSVERVLTE